MTSSAFIRAGLALLLSSVALAAAAQDNFDAQQLADRWVQAYNSHNRAAIGRLYTADAHLMMHGSTTLKGRDRIEEFWAEDFLAENPLTVLTVTHVLEGADMVLVHGNYQVINRDNGLVVGMGRFAHIWNKDADGEWRLDRDLWNEPFEAYRR